jgi:hypothetical protein
MIHDPFPDQRIRLLYLLQIPVSVSFRANLEQDRTEQGGKVSGCLGGGARIAVPKGLGGRLGGWSGGRAGGAAATTHRVGHGCLRLFFLRNRLGAKGWVLMGPPELIVAC